MEESYRIMVLERRGVHDHLLQAHEWSILTSRKSSNSSRRPTWITRSSWQLKHKKEAHEMWILWACRDRVGNVKAHLELNLARGLKDNKMGCYRNRKSKRRTRENVGLLLNGAKETEMQLKHSLLPPCRHLSIFVTSSISKPRCIS